MAAVHPRFRTPAAAVLLTTGVMLALALSRTFLYLVTVIVVARLVTYFATRGALPLLRRRKVAPASVFRLPGGTFIACAAMLVCVWLLSNSRLTEARAAAVAAAIGLAIYLVCRRRSAV